ncbi:PEP-CTERM domain protein [Haloferula sp. BvORR071]|uniref:PEP-CTERM domain protein n=1 Tax=Haloferula sp. BvORR071 TaxID=1396141 RepID=UPI00054EB1A2|nr:PEP-CTERM domain protein [Haloferula sp. BvORR071]
MKLKPFVALALASLLAAAAQAGAAVISIGSGADSAFFVLESANIGSRTYEIHFDNNVSEPLDGYDLLQMVDAFEPNLSVLAFNFGSEEAPNYFVNSITWQGVTETNAEDFSAYWGQFVAGGQAGFPAASPVPAGTWTFGSGLSAPSRVVEPGSWDGLVFGDGSLAPGVNPVPEPASALLALGGLLAFLKRRR